MIEVTKDQFFAALYADKRDIMPRNTDPTYTDWETPHRHQFGRTYPGWKNPGDPKRYLLAQKPAAGVPVAPAPGLSKRVADAVAALATHYDELPHAAQRDAVKRLFQMVRDDLAAPGVSEAPHQTFSHQTPTGDGEAP